MLETISDNDNDDNKMMYLSVLMIDHNVMRLNVPVHDALTMAVVEGLEQLVDVVANIDVVELRIEAAEVGVVDILKDQRGCFTLCDHRMVNIRVFK